MSYTKSGICLPRETERRPAPNRRRWSPTMGLAAVVNADGSIAFQEDDWTTNALIDEGEASINNVWLGGGANPSKFLCLINGTTTAPIETSTMAYLGGGAGAQETQVPAAGGYNRQQVVNGVGGVDWTDDGLVGGDNRYSSAEKTFGAATVTWTVSHAGMVTASTGQLAGSGKFLLFLPLSATTTIASTQSFKYILRQTIS